MPKQRFEKELKLKISKQMDRELALVSEMSGLYGSEIIRNAIRNEITRLKKMLRETFLRPEEWVTVRDLAAPKRHHHRGDAL